MGPIFNEKVTDKWNLWVRHLCSLWKSQQMWTEKKKKKKKEKTAKQKRKCYTNLNPNGYLFNL